MSIDERERLALIARVVRGLGRTAAQHALFSQAIAAQLGIGPTDLECLLLLQDQGAATAGQLADVLGLTTGAVTGVVDRLANAGFVVRESDPADRRRVIVQPVAARLADVERAYEPLVWAVARSIGGASEADLRHLLDFQQRAANLLEQQIALMKADANATRATTQLSAPLGDARTGRLEFATGCADVRIYGADIASFPDLLYEATFEGAQPTARVQGGAVTFRYRRMGLFEWGAGKHSGVVGLNPVLPWKITLRGGASGVSVDVGGLQLRELTVSGGATKLDICLPAPEGVVPVCIEGGVNRVQIQHPPQTAVQLQVRGGANRLEFDAQRFGAIGGDVRLATSGWDLATDRYAIEVHGGASRLTVQEAE